MDIRALIARSSMLSGVKTGASIAVALSLLIFVMAPFSTALAVHHELAAADHDGHEHSDNDLCQWVQYHTGHSLVGDVPTACSLFHPIASKLLPQAFCRPLTCSDSVSSRAPPTA
jgi:hypothetical protein